MFIKQEFILDTCKNLLEKFKIYNIFICISIAARHLSTMFKPLQTQYYFIKLEFFSSIINSH